MTAANFIIRAERSLSRFGGRWSDSLTDQNVQSSAGSIDGLSSSPSLAILLSFEVARKFRSPTRFRKPMTVFETARLTLRQLTELDAGFIFELVNDPDWLRYIGDRGVRSIEDAGAYIRNGPRAMYERVGFGLWLVERKGDRAPLGICGLIRRDTLDDVDVGFAFLPAYRGEGYAFEAAAATLACAKNVHGLSRIVAITSLDNSPSIRLLGRLGFRFEKQIRLRGEDHDVRLYEVEL